MEQLTTDELNERVAILKKFRHLLEQQRAKFQEYLKVLEAQESKITQEDSESLIAHSELENQIVQSIYSLQKVIVPMQELYNNSKVASYNPNDVIPITQIQDDLTKLQSKVLAQNEKNRSLLKIQIGQLRTQIAEFRNPCRSLNSIYAQKDRTTGTRIQIEV